MTGRLVADRDDWSAVGLFGLDIYILLRIWLFIYNFVFPAYGSEKDEMINNLLR